MNSDSASITRIGALCVADEILGGISVNGLGWLKTHPESPLLELIEANCTRCGDPIGKIQRLWANSCACEPCRMAYLDESANARIRMLWNVICPLAFQDTKTDHPSFPSKVWALPAVQKWDGGRSLLLYGDTRTGKTRTAFLLLKRAAMKGLNVGVVWPEDLRELAAARSSAPLRQLADRDVLLLDDLLAAAMGEDRYVEILKQLVDMLIRGRKTYLMTSQIGGAESTSEVGRFGGPSAGQLKRAAALIERIRETSTLISFANASQDEPF